MTLSCLRVICVGSLLFWPIGIAPAESGQGGETPWGDPNVQGIWDFRTATPLERPSDLAGRVVLTAEEAAAYEQEASARRNDYDATPTVHAKFWLDYGSRLTDDRRTSLIVEPEDGRIPALTPAAQERARARRELRSRPPTSYEDRSLGERCLQSINAGPPMTPGPYNNNVHILQTPDYVVLHNEMIHDVRVIPLDGRDHITASIRQSRGDSRGHWEGKTLIVETTNFTNRTAFRNSSGNLHLIERFTLHDVGTLSYEYRIEDPQSYASAWSAVLPMKRTEGPMFEFACHEGNYGLRNILVNARAADRND